MAIRNPKITRAPASSFTFIAGSQRAISSTSTLESTRTQMSADRRMTLNALAPLLPIELSGDYFLVATGSLKLSSAISESRRNSSYDSTKLPLCQPLLISILRLQSFKVIG